MLCLLKKHLNLIVLAFSKIKKIALMIYLGWLMYALGIPHLTEGDVTPQGGKPGWAALPNPRIGPWLKLLKKIAQSHNLIPEFEVPSVNMHEFLGPCNIYPSCNTFLCPSSLGIICANKQFTALIFFTYLIFVFHRFPQYRSLWKLHIMDLSLVHQPCLWRLVKFL